MRLKLASIVKIENVDQRLQVKYLSKRSTCTDQAMQLIRRKENYRELDGRQGKRAVVGETTVGETT